MPARYSDINISPAGVSPADSRSNTKTNDFIIRKRTPTMPQLLAIFFGAMIVEVGVVLAASEGDKIALIAILLIMLSSIGCYVLVQLQRNRDLVMTTEFQNALFASALGLNNKFCLIIRQDGTIIYLDRSFQNLFPDFLKHPQRTVDVLLEYGRISPEDSKKIYAAIERNIYDKVAFSIRDSQAHLHKVVMSIEPIVRPAGFILLRGREYVEQRSNSPMPHLSDTPQVLNKSTIALFSYVMDTMDMGVYMTDPTGNIIYANPTFEHWLGFKEGEITSSSLSLQDLVYHNSERAKVIAPGDYEGIVKLQKKTGGLMQGFVNQKIIRNEEEKPIGCTALVHNITEQTDAKKQLW